MADTVASRVADRERLAREHGKLLEALRDLRNEAAMVVNRSSAPGARRLRALIDAVLQATVAIDEADRAEDR
jgi:molybdate-binding protein